MLAQKRSLEQMYTYLLLKYKSILAFDDIKNKILGTKKFLLIPIPGFIYKISFLKKWENLHHYLTYFERTLFRILLFANKYLFLCMFLFIKS